MSRIRGAATGDLLSAAAAERASLEPLADGAILLRGYACDGASAIASAIDAIVAEAPFRHMVTPGGFRMSVAMTNCGRAGWITDRSGYRYSLADPLTDRPWPALPGLLSELATRAAAAAGYPRFEPDACLINRYEPGARLTLHQDRNERDLARPVVSISLGLPATFLFGGNRRSDRPRRVRLEHGDVVVWGGPARLAFHGIDPLADGDHPLTGRCRINLTLRKAL